MFGSVEDALPGRAPKPSGAARCVNGGAPTIGAPTIGAWTHAEPPSLPLELRLEDIGLSLDALRASIGSEQMFGPLKENNPAKARLGFSEPPIGRLLGAKLARQVGALVSRPGCAFSKSWLWRCDRGSEIEPHTDRVPLDVTMSIPIVLDGVDVWPVRMRQPGGDVVEWPSRPGTALVFDGRWRQHWRDPFQGRCAMVLLLHWRAPAVVWPQFLDDRLCRRLRDGALPQADWADLLEGSTALACSAVPPTTPPALEIVDLRGPDIPRPGRDVVLLAPLSNELALTFDRAKVTLAPGDGVAFATRDECGLHWRHNDRANAVLLGRGQR